MTTEQTQGQPETRPSEVRSDALLCGVLRDLDAAQQKLVMLRTRNVRKEDSKKWAELSDAYTHSFQHINSARDGIRRAT